MQLKRLHCELKICWRENQKERTFFKNYFVKIIFCYLAQLQQEFQRAWVSSIKFLITKVLSQKQPQRFSLKITVGFMTENLYHLIQLFLGVSKLKMSKLSTKGIFEKLDMLNKLNPLTYMANGSKKVSSHSLD